MTKDQEKIYRNSFLLLLLILCCCTMLAVHFMVEWLEYTLGALTIGIGLIAFASAIAALPDKYFED